MKVGFRPHIGSSTNKNFKQANIAMQTVPTVRPGPTRHPFRPFNKQRSTQSPHRHCSTFEQNMMRLNEITTSYTRPNTKDNFKFKHTQSNKNVRSGHSGPTRHPSHACNEQRSTRSRRRHYSLFGHQNNAFRRMQLRNYTALNSKTFKFKRT